MRDFFYCPPVNHNFTTAKVYFRSQKIDNDLKFIFLGKKNSLRENELNS